MVIIFSGLKLPYAGEAPHAHFNLRRLRSDEG